MANNPNSIGDTVLRQQRQEPVHRFIDCLLGFGSDAEANINRLTALCGKTMGATCCLFNRLDDGMLCSVGQWQTPPGFRATDKADGHICYDVIRQAGDQPLLIRNLPATAYARSDPNVAAYGLQSYIGIAVKCHGQVAGSLCVVYQDDVTPSAEQLDFMRMCSFFLAVEVQRQQAEATLREKATALASEQAQLTALFDGTGDALYVADPETYELLYVNSVVQKLFGPDIGGRKCFRVLQNRETPCPFCTNNLIFGEHLGETHVWTFQNQVNGRWYRCADKAIRWPDGRFVRFEQASDISERKCAEEDLRQGLRRESAIGDILRLSLAELPLETLLEKALDTVLAMPELALEARGAVFLVEGDPPVLVLKAQRNLAAPLLVTCARVPFGQCLCGRAAASGQVEFAADLDERHETRHEGSQPHGHYCVPMRFGDRTIGVLNLYVQAGYFRSARLEQFLLGIANALAGVIARKAAEAAHAALETQLRQAQKMEAVGRLAGGVAHDFNNKLQTILGITELLLTDADPENPVTADLNEIRMAAQHSAGLTRQLLAFARKQTIAPKVLDLNDMLAETFKMLQRLIGEDIALVWMPAVDLWPVKMDPSQLDQVLANLTVNARDAIAGVGRVTIQTGNAEFDADYCAAHPDVAPGAYAMLAVSDDGCGMDTETQSHLFEPFFTTKEQGKGTGLGLSTVYGIVRQNNGFIDVVSQPGKGTTFKIYLPRHTATVEESAAAQAAKATPTGTETVLLVEDEAPLLRLAGRLLMTLGYTVLAADGPDAALRLAAEYRGNIHLLLTDLVMPGMSGSDLRQRLTRLRPALKCLFMSGYTADTVARCGVLDEGTHFIQKPFSTAALAVKLRVVLGT